MIEGITVLNNIIVNDFNPVPWLIVLVGLLFLAVIIVGMSDESNKKNMKGLWCWLFGIALILLVADIRYSKVDAIQCTIDDNVSIHEVYDKYDVIDKQGEIWTLREKTDEEA